MVDRLIAVGFRNQVIFASGRFKVMDPWCVGGWKSRQRGKEVVKRRGGYEHIRSQVESISRFLSILIYLFISLFLYLTIPFRLEFGISLPYTYVVNGIEAMSHLPTKKKKNAINGSFIKRKEGFHPRLILKSFTGQIRDRASAQTLSTPLMC